MEHRIRFFLDLLPGDADDPVSAQTERAVASPVPLEGGRMLVVSAPISFDDEALRLPQEVDLDSFASNRDQLVAAGQGKPASRDKSKQLRLQLTPQPEAIDFADLTPLVEDRPEDWSAAAGSASQRGVYGGNVQSAEHRCALDHSPQ